MSGIMTPTVLRFWTNAGVPLASGKVYTYVAGTTTPKTVYKDSALSVAHTNPITLDANGSVGFAMFGTGTYKIDVKDSAGTSINGFPIDNVSLSLDGIVADLADTSLATLGDAMVGVKKTDGGASATTLHVVMQQREFDLVADFGGSTASGFDNYTALSTAISNLQNTGNILKLKGMFEINTNTPLVATGHMNIQGHSYEYSGLKFGSTVSGWGLTICPASSNFFTGSSTIKNMQMKTGSSSSLSGVLRIVDAINCKIEDFHIDLAALGTGNTVEMLRIENDQLFCESLLLRNLKLKGGLKGIRYVPASEAAVADRYRAVTGSGTDSFNQNRLYNVEINNSVDAGVIASAYGYILNGNFARSAFYECGGFYGGNNSAIFKIVSDPQGLLLSSPWGDTGGGSGTARGLFQFDAAAPRLMILAPQVGGVFFDRASSSYYSPGQYFNGTLISYNENPNRLPTMMANGHMMADGKYFRIEDEFEDLNTSRWVVTNTCAVEASDAQTEINLNPNSNVARIGSRALVWNSTSDSESFLSFEIRCKMPDTTTTYLWAGTGRDQLTTETSLGSLRSGHFFTNENVGHTAVTSNLYFVVMSDVAGTETSRLDLGSYSSGTFVNLKFIMSRNDSVIRIYRDDVYKGSATVNSYPQYASAGARNPGAASKIYVDRIVISGNRS